MTDRKAPSTHIITYFKQRAKAYSTNKTANARQGAANDMDYYLARYINLDQYDPRQTGTMTTKNDSKDYIEVNMSGLVLRKQGANLTVKYDAKIEYNEANLLVFRRTLDAGLEVIATAAKHEPTTTTTGVEL